MTFLFPQQIVQASLVPEKGSLSLESALCFVERGGERLAYAPEIIQARIVAGERSSVWKQVVTGSLALARLRQDASHVSYEVLVAHTAHPFLDSKNVKALREGSLDLKDVWKELEERAHRDFQIHYSQTPLGERCETKIFLDEVLQRPVVVVGETSDLEQRYLLEKVLCFKLRSGPFALAAENFGKIGASLVTLPPYRSALFYDDHQTVDLKSEIRGKFIGLPKEK